MSRHAAMTRFDFALVLVFCLVALPPAAVAQSASEPARPPQPATEATRPPPPATEPARPPPSATEPARPPPPATEPGRPTSTAGGPAAPMPAASLTVLESLSLDPAVEARTLALDCRKITATDVADTLSHVPAPRLFLLHGGVYPVYLVMWSFARFLNGMGYPEERIRDPRTGEWTYTPYDTTDRLVGLIGAAYEREGLRPMIIGHSQGGLFAVKILKHLAGLLGPRARIYDPNSGEFEERTTIVDPLTGRERPVIGLSTSYASAVGAGGFALALPAWWENLETLRLIPDSVDEFTGFFVGNDVIALSFPGNPLDTRYTSMGKAVVRNVDLPESYSHITVPDADGLLADPAARAWVDAYVPDSGADASGLSAEAQAHVLYAADVWYSVKKHWCLEAQTLIRAKRAAGSTKARG